MAERHGRGSARGRPPRGRADAPASAAAARPSSSSTRRDQRDDRRVDRRAASRAGRSANIARTLASSDVRPGRRHDLARRASRRRVARAARSWSASQVAGSNAARSARKARHRAHDLGRLVEAAQELVDVHAGRGLERLPAAVDEHEARAARRRAPRAAQAATIAPNPWPARTTRSPGSPRAAPTPRRRRRVLGEGREVVARLGRGVGQAVAAQVHRHDVARRRAAGARPASTTRRCCEQAVDQQDARAPSAPRPGRPSRGSGSGRPASTTTTKPVGLGGRVGGGDGVERRLHRP